MVYPEEIFHDIRNGVQRVPTDKKRAHLITLFVTCIFYYAKVCMST